MGPLLKFFEQRFNIPAGRAAWGVLEIKDCVVGHLFRPCVMVKGSDICLDIDKEKFTSAYGRKNSKKFARINSADVVEEDEFGVKIISRKVLADGQFHSIYIPAEVIERQYHGRTWTGDKPKGFYPPLILFTI